MTTESIPGLVALAAECTDVRLVEDGLTTYCYAEHLTLGPVCLAGRTEELAIEAVRQHYLRLKHGTATAYDHGDD